jgi:hypothetical protein
MNRLERHLSLPLAIAYEVLQRGREVGPVVAYAEIASITTMAVVLAAGAVAVALVALPVAAVAVLIGGRR